MSTLENRQMALGIIEEQKNVAKSEPTLQQGAALPDLSPGINAPRIAEPGATATKEVENTLQDTELQKMKEGVAAALKEANVPDGKIVEALNNAGNDLPKLKALAAEAEILNSDNPADNAKKQEIADSRGIAYIAAGDKVLSQKGTSGSVDGTSGEESTGDDATDKTPSVIAAAESLDNPSNVGNMGKYTNQMNGGPLSTMKADDALTGIVKAPSITSGKNKIAEEVLSRSPVTAPPALVS